MAQYWHLSFKISSVSKWIFFKFIHSNWFTNQNHIGYKSETCLDTTKKDKNPFLESTIHWKAMPFYGISINSLLSRRIVNKLTSSKINSHQSASNSSFIGPLCWKKILSVWPWWLWSALAAACKTFLGKTLTINSFSRWVKICLRWMKNWTQE